MSNRRKVSPQWLVQKSTQAGQSESSVAQVAASESSFKQVTGKVRILDFSIYLLFSIGPKQCKRDPETGSILNHMLPSRSASGEKDRAISFKIPVTLIRTLSNYCELGATGCWAWLA